MRKGTGTKTRISITIDIDTAERISKYCGKKMIKVSNYIEKLAKEGIEKDEKK